jgi:predicted DNA-binding transcriptional regulator YafY
MHYEDRNRKVTTRVIDPFGLVSKAGVWYLVARSGTEMRSFRADRIQSAEELPESFERPPDFNLDAYWSDSMSRFREEHVAERYAVTICVHDSEFGDVANYWESEELERNAADERTIRVTFPAEGSAVHQLLAWGTRVSILDPLALRDRVVQRALEVVTHYGPSAG